MNRKSILVFVLLAGIFTWQCTKDDMGENKSLKESVKSNALNLNNAINETSATRGYKLLSLSDGTGKSVSIKDGSFNDSITLDKIAGIYEFKPAKIHNWCFWCYNKLFEKTGTSSQLIVKLPAEKVFHPKKFQAITAADSALKNNFVITTTDYHYYFSHGFLYDYKMASKVSISDTAIGNMAIESKLNKSSGFNYSSKYTFENGVTIKLQSNSGDTASSSVSLLKDSTLLFKESVTRIKSQDKKYREKQYVIIIGNVEIRRTTAHDSTSVYLNGILQVNAKVEFIDKENNDEDGGMCRKNDRDIKITFDDGSTAMVSELIGPSLTTLQSMVASLKSVYFATNIVDYMAFSIYKNH